MLASVRSIRSLGTSSPSCGDTLRHGGGRRLEHAKLSARMRRGTLMAQKRQRGRPLIGTGEERRRALREHEAWRRPPQQDPEPVRQQRFVRLPGGHYHIVWEVRHVGRVGGSGLAPCC